MEAQMRMDHGTKSEILLYLRFYHTEGAHIIHSGGKAYNVCLSGWEPWNASPTEEGGAKNAKTKNLGKPEYLFVPKYSS